MCAVGPGVAPSEVPFSFCCVRLRLCIMMADEADPTSGCSGLISAREADKPWGEGDRFAESRRV